jgi:hypothetical protein
MGRPTKNRNTKSQSRVKSSGSLALILVEGPFRDVKRRPRVREAYELCRLGVQGCAQAPLAPPEANFFDTLRACMLKFDRKIELW